MIRPRPPASSSSRWCSPSASGGGTRSGSARWTGRCNCNSPWESGAGEGAGRGAVPWAAAEPERAATGVHPGRAVEGSESAGTGQAPGGQPLDRWAAAEPERAATGVHPGRAVEGSESAGTGQAPGGQPLDHSTGGQIRVGWKLQPRHGAWPVGSLPQYQRGQRYGKVLQPVHACPRGLSGGFSPASESNWVKDRASAGGKRTDRPPALTPEQVEQALAGAADGPLP